jgi:hypothetical protein
MAAKTLFDGGATSKLFLDRRVFYPEPNKVAELWTDITPFKTFVTKMGVKKLSESAYKMFEHESGFVKREFTTTTALTIAADGTESEALTISGQVGISTTVDGAYLGLVFEIWDSTKREKRGVIFVTTASTTIKCKTMKATAITTVSGDYFIATGGRVRGEGSVAWAGEHDELSVRWNQTAFLSDSCEITGDLYHTDKIRGYSNEFARLREEMMKRYSTGTEQTLLTSVSTVGTNFNSSDTFSEASLRTISDPNSSSGAVRTTYGYIPILEDYGTTYTGTGAVDPDTNTFKIPTATLDYSTLIKYFEVIFDKRESDEAFAFIGRGALTKIAQKIASDTDKFNWKGKVTMGTAKTNLTFGFKQIEFQTPHGVLYLVPTRSLRNQYNNYMIIPDYQNIGVAQFTADEYGNNVKTDDDYDGIKDTIKSRKGLWMQLLKRHHMMVLEGE